MKSIRAGLHYQNDRVQSLTKVSLSRTRNVPSTPPESAQYSCRSLSAVCLPSDIRPWNQGSAWWSSVPPWSDWGEVIRLNYTIYSLNLRHFKVNLILIWSLSDSPFQRPPLVHSPQHNTKSYSQSHSSACTISKHRHSHTEITLIIN